MHFEDWGLVPYKDSTERQLDYLDKVASGSLPDSIIFCKHPSVVTLGKATTESDLAGWKGETFQSQRGGKATYHGPEQLVIYPIIDLNRHTKDLHKHLRKLEQALSKCLVGEYGIEAEGGREDATGVWIGSQKIASIGIAVRKWVTYHGMAININRDPLAFTGISPCGFTTSTMTSLEELTGKKTSYEDFQNKLAPYLEKEFQLT